MSVGLKLQARGENLLLDLVSIQFCGIYRALSLTPSWLMTRKEPEFIYVLPPSMLVVVGWALKFLVSVTSSVSSSSLSFFVTSY